MRVVDSEPLSLINYSNTVAGRPALYGRPGAGGFSHVNSRAAATDIIIPPSCLCTLGSQDITGSS